MNCFNLARQRYQELDGKSLEQNIISDKEKLREFWSGIRNKDVKQ